MELAAAVHSLSGLAFQRRFYSHLFTVKADIILGSKAQQAQVLKAGKRWCLLLPLMKLFTSKPTRFAFTTTSSRFNNHSFISGLYPGAGF